MDRDELLWQISKLGRLRFWYQIRHRRWVLEVFVGLNNTLAIGILGYLAHLTSWPLIFPSLGPSLFLIFYAPQKAMSSPRNTFLAHLLGGGMGFLVYKLFCYFTLISSPGFGLGKMFSAALVVGILGFLMVRLRILHPPAASTALIAATGYLPHWHYLLILALALFIIISQAKIFHFLAGVKYPWWAPLEEEAPEIFTQVGKLRIKERPENLKDLAQQLAFKGRPD